MDGVSLLVILLVVCAVGLAAVLVILRRMRSDQANASRESPIAASSEGMKVCPRCAGENLWTEATCIFCGQRLG